MLLRRPTQRAQPRVFNLLLCLCQAVTAFCLDGFPSLAGAHADPVLMKVLTDYEDEGH